MKFSQKLQEQRGSFVEQSLGDSVICERCGATLATFADVCTAALNDPCPGFGAIEAAKNAFEASRAQAHRKANEKEPKQCL